jgi:hypothetical protein
MMDFMTKNEDINSAVEKLLEFAEYYLTLGDLSGHDLLMTIGERSPQFTYDIEHIKVPIDTIMDLLRAYGDWGIELVRNQCAGDWNEVKNACTCSTKYQFLRKQWKDTTELWDELEKALNSGGDK